MFVIVEYGAAGLQENTFAHAHSITTWAGPHLTYISPTHNMEPCKACRHAAIHVASKISHMNLCSFMP